MICGNPLLGLQNYLNRLQQSYALKVNFHVIEKQLCCVKSVGTVRSVGVYKVFSENITQVMVAWFMVYITEIYNERFCYCCCERKYSSLFIHMMKASSKTTQEQQCFKIPPVFVFRNGRDFRKNVQCLFASNMKYLSGITNKVCMQHCISCRCFRITVLHLFCCIICYEHHCKQHDLLTNFCLS